jgi:predicted nucleic acid-binding protein
VEIVVLDASVAVAWVHPAQATEGTKELLRRAEKDIRIVVPAIWSMEVANALVVLERRGNISPQERDVALAALRIVTAEIDCQRSDAVFTAVARLAVDQQLSIYDASYIELSMRRGIPLASRDRKQCEAGRRCGVELCF